MFRNILIPLDGSDLSQRVLSPLRHMLGGDEVGKVTLLQVLRQGEDPSAIRAKLEGLVALISASGAPAEAQVCDPEDAGDAVLRVAESIDADLIAMATHGRSGLSRLLRGSVAERVLRRCPRPLLLFNPGVLQRDEIGGEVFRRILVPLDGSELAARILAPAAALAKIYDAELALLKVENFATDGGKSALRTVEEVLATLEPVKKRLLEEGVGDVSTHAKVGSDVAEILGCVERLGIDLLALSTHGRTGASRLWFGSVAEALLRKAACPLFVVRASTPAE